MSYNWEPIFRCCICGKTEPAWRWQYVPLNVPFGYKWLPEGWTGSTRKRGECYCDGCSRAIERIRGGR